MKIQELRAKTSSELEVELANLLQAHFGLRMRKATQQLTDHSEIGKTRRSIARVKTLLNETRGEAK